MTSRRALAFQRDLEARGLADRVCPRLERVRPPPEENSSRHRSRRRRDAFLSAPGAAGQMIGEFPGLGTLDEDDNLRATVDFRGVYCALLEQWFGVDAGPIIPSASQFTPPQLLKP